MQGLAVFTKTVEAVLMQRWINSDSNHGHDVTDESKRAAGIDRYRAMIVRGYRWRATPELSSLVVTEYRSFRLDWAGVCAYRILSYTAIVSHDLASRK